MLSRPALLLMVVAGALRAAGGEATSRATRELSIDDVVRMALERNLRLAAEKLNPQRADAVVEEQRGAFDPVAVGEVSASGLRTVPRQQGAESRRRQMSASAGIVKLFELGTTVEAKTGGGRLWSNEPDLLVNPAYDALWSVSIAQPLLRGFGVRVNTARIASSLNERRIAIAQLRHVGIQTVREAKRNYWELVHAIRAKALLEQAQARAEHLVDLVNVRVQAKDLGPHDPSVGQAKAGVAARHERVVVADDNIRAVEDRLRVITEMAADPASWGQALTPTTEPVVTEPTLDVDRAMEVALANRPDYQAAQILIENQDLAVEVARNGLLPRLDLKASLANTGLGDTPHRAGHSFGTFDNYEWSFGLVLEVPLGNRAERARYRRANLDRQQAVLGLRILERQIQIEVRDAIRAVTTSLERLRAAEATVRAEEDRVRAEEIRFKEAKLGTSQDVLFAQDALADAELRRLRALIDLNIALVELERAKGTLLDSSNVFFFEDRN